jgi:hypothetical protein
VCCPGGKLEFLEKGWQGLAEDQPAPQARRPLRLGRIRRGVRRPSFVRSLRTLP